MTTTTNELVGQVIDQCRVDSRLGQGGMGVVYRGWHLGLDLEVAIKVLPPGLSSNEEFIQRFYREARQAARLDHPNIVRVLNVGSHEGHHFIVMQFIDGPDLRRVVEQRGGLPAAEATLYIGQALAGLDYAHNRGVIHRDIKPENLMITPEGVIKITDFGLARGTSEGDSSLTKTGQVMGTPHFMPMEQWDGAQVDHRADVYAMGVSLYYLLSGKLPITGSQPTVIVRQLALGEITPLVAVVPDVDPQLECIVERMMEREREKRYQTSGEALRDLQKWRENHIPDATPLVSAAYNNVPAAPPPPPAPLTELPLQKPSAPMTFGALSGVEGLEELGDLSPEALTDDGADAGSQLQPTVVSAGRTPSGRQSAVGPGGKKKKKKKKKPAGAGRPAVPPPPSPNQAQQKMQRAVMIGGMVVAGILLLAIGMSLTAGGGNSSNGTTDSDSETVAAGESDGNPSINGGSGTDATTNADTETAGDTDTDAETPGNGRRRVVPVPTTNANSNPGPDTEGPGPDFPGPGPDANRPGPDGPPGPPPDAGENDPRRVSHELHQRRQQELTEHATSFAEALAAGDRERLMKFVDTRGIAEQITGGRGPARQPPPGRLEEFVANVVRRGIEQFLEKAANVDTVAVKEVFVHDDPRMQRDTWTLGEVSFTATADGQQGEFMTQWYFRPLSDGAEHGNWYVVLPRPGERPRPFQRGDRPGRPGQGQGQDQGSGPGPGNRRGPNR